MRLAKPTVGEWRSRFVARRLDGLLDEPRPGAPREISDAAVERVLRLGGRVVVPRFETPGFRHAVVVENHAGPGRLGDHRIQQRN